VTLGHDSCHPERSRAHERPVCHPDRSVPASGVEGPAFRRSRNALDVIPSSRGIRPNVFSRPGAEMHLYSQARSTKSSRPLSSQSEPIGQRVSGRTEDARMTARCSLYETYTEGMRPCGSPDTAAIVRNAGAAQDSKRPAACRYRSSTTYADCTGRSAHRPGHGATAAGATGPDEPPHAATRRGRPRRRSPEAVAEPRTAVNSNARPLARSGVYVIPPGPYAITGLNFVCLLALAGSPSIRLRSMSLPR
jgi:hypothetical protein